MNSTSGLLSIEPPCQYPLLSIQTILIGLGPRVYLEINRSIFFQYRTSQPAIFSSIGLTNNQRVCIHEAAIVRLVTLRLDVAGVIGYICRTL